MPGGNLMKRVAVITDSAERAARLKARLNGFLEAEFFQLDEPPDTLPRATLVDINLRDPGQTSQLKLWSQRRPASEELVVAVDRDCHRDAIQAYAMGATDLMPRPIDGRLLSWKLSREVGAIVRAGADFAAGASTAISAGTHALQHVFAAGIAGNAPDMKLLDTAGSEIVDQVGEEGLVRWLELVRTHHSQTYQHCLTVTAVAVSFGQHLGFHSGDQRRLASAGLLHDVGKARIPIDILEKAAPLNDAEKAVMRTHPELGLETLRDSPGLQPEMIDMVVHHHEYLDGSGYPHGLQASEISDLVRTITIADIYGALIEKRAYKPPMSGAQAYEVLQDMGSKLDRDMVRAFRPLAHSVP
jgi:putative nucleotidyltransferase with HDIG domain